MSVKANWFAEIAAGGSEDPFACHSEQLGLEVDLRDPEAMQETLTELMRRESDLFDQGVRCGLRERSDTVCSACPVRRTDVLDAMTPLCDAAIEMERICTTLAAHAIEPDRPDSGLAGG